MDFNATIDLIIKDLEEASEIINDLKKYPGVPVLQVELARSKCRSAGEIISLLKSVGDSIQELTVIRDGQQQQNQNKSADDKQTSAISQISDSPAEGKKDEITVVENVPKIKRDKQEDENVPDFANETLKEQVTEIREPLSSLEEKKKVKKNVKDPSESSIIADKFRYLSSRFNEQMGNMKGDSDATDIFSTKRVSNLFDAIGVNDRFLFIREIFDDNKDEYNKTILQLNNAENLNDARDIIMDCTGYNEENKAVKQLLSLVKRKLPSNE